MQNQLIYNPCTQPFTNNSLQGCASKNPMCPEGLFCQIGVEPQQSFCCPIIGNMAISLVSISN